MPVTIGGSGPITGVTSINTTVSDTELGYLDGVTSALQTQINAKANDSSQGLYLITPSSIANSGGSASASGGAVTFTTVNSVSLNGVFTASYQNYLVTLTMTSAAQSLVTMRMRSSGSDASGANYNVQALNVSNTTVAGVQSLSGTSFRVSTSESSGTTVNQIFIGAPFDSTNTSMTAMNGRLTNTIEIDLRVGNHTVAQSYDGFTVIGSTSISGTVRVYGYKNS